MALPRVNETLNFNMTVPSSGQVVKYRPYLVKEEKVLLQAFESRDTKMCLSAMGDTLSACLDQRAEIDVNSLTSFDIEYMFTQLRAKSVGETSKILIKCNQSPITATGNEFCGEQNEYVVDLEKLKVETKRESDPTYNIIKITDSIHLEMKYPTFDTMYFIAEKKESGTNAQLETMANCIVAVLTEDERIPTEEQSKEEVLEFLLSMTAHQIKPIADFLNEMPKLKHQAEFKCTACGQENSVELSGLSDFF
jgi:hypothetical protein